MLQMHWIVARPSEKASENGESDEASIVPIIIDFVADEYDHDEGSANDPIRSHGTLKKRHLAVADIIISHERTPIESMEVAESHIFRPIFRSRIVENRRRTKKAIRTSVPGRKSHNIDHQQK